VVKSWLDVIDLLPDRIYTGVRPFWSQPRLIAKRAVYSGFWLVVDTFNLPGVLDVLFCQKNNQTFANL
jgi:hypothetical protein